MLVASCGVGLSAHEFTVNKCIVPAYPQLMDAGRCHVLKGLDVKYQMYKDVRRQWRWRLLAANNRIIANSGEGYVNKTDCLAAINLVKASSKSPVYEVTS